jgi:hypothetical protein
MRIEKINEAKNQFNNLIELLKTTVNSSFDEQIKSLLEVKSLFEEIDENEDYINYSFKKNTCGVTAAGIEIDNKFMVKRGSTISKKTVDSMSESNKKIRQSLLDQGIVVNYTFVRDYTFDSKSCAASVLFGGSASGTTYWITK